MTEAGKKWVYEQAKGGDPEDYEQSHALSQRAAEFWLRAFCDELRNRAEACSGTYEERYSDAFHETQRELLGEK